MEKQIHSGAVVEMCIRDRLRDIANTYQVEDGNISYLTNTVQMWNRVTKDSCQKLLDTAESDPDKFLDMKYLMQVNETLQGKNSYMIVMRDNEEVYVRCV